MINVDDDDNEAHNVMCNDDDNDLDGNEKLSNHDIDYFVNDDDYVDVNNIHGDYG